MKVKRDVLDVNRFNVHFRFTVRVPYWDTDSAQKLSQLMAGTAYDLDVDDHTILIEVWSYSNRRSVKEFTDKVIGSIKDLITWQRHHQPFNKWLKQEMEFPV